MQRKPWEAAGEWTELTGAVGLFLLADMRVKLRSDGLGFTGIQGPKARFMAAQGIALGNGITMNIEG